jgi:hypothetical protein
MERETSETSAAVETNETSHTETPETAHEHAEPKKEKKVGDTVEVTRLDGGTSNDVVAGFVETSSEKVEIHARKQGETVAMRPVNSGEVEAREQALKQLNLLKQAYTDGIEIAIKAMGLKGDKAEEARVQLKANEDTNIAAATQKQDSAKALDTALQESIKIKIVQESIGTLLQKRRKLQQEAESARQKSYKIGSIKNAVKQEDTESEYNKELQKSAVKSECTILAIERQIFNLRLELNPNADKAKQAKIADEVEGFVVPITDELYNKGCDAVVERIQQLVDQKRAADKTKFAEAAYLIAEDEQKRHMVMLPILERVKKIRQAEKETEELIAQTEKKHKKEIKNARGKISREKRNWQKAGDDIAKILGRIERQLDGMRKKGEDMDDRKKQDAKVLIDGYQRIQERLEGLNAEYKALETAKVKFDFDEFEKTDAARTALYHQLRESYTDKKHPEYVKQIMEYVNSALKNKSTAESTRVILDAFRTDAQNGTFTEADKPKTTEAPPTAVKQPAETPESSQPSVEAHAVTAEVPKSPQPLSDDERAMKDLVDAGILQEGGDLKALLKNYHEVLYALEKVKISPKTKGLPETSDEIINVKDKRGFFGKLLNRKTIRVKLAKKVFALHYEYIDSGQVDISDFKR